MQICNICSASCSTSDNDDDLLVLLVTQQKTYQCFGSVFTPNSNLKRFYGLGMRLNNFFFFLSAVSKYITLENCPSMFDLVTFHR